MTSVSSLGSSSSSAYISSLDKNGDGIISADELAAANTTSTTTKSSTSTASGSDSASVTQKIAADILSMMLQIQQSDSSDDTSDDGSDDDKGLLATLDTNGDGKLTSDEVLSADPSKIAASADGGDEEIIAEVLTDMQTALRAYQNTYGTSPAADSGSEDIQTA